MAPHPIFDITAYGAIGDGKTVNTRACQAAACACRDHGGGTLLVPPGDFVTGILQIFGNTVLRIEKGGRLIASPAREDHRVGDAVGGLLYALDAPNIVVTGEGILDGNADRFFSHEVVPMGADFCVSETRQGQHGAPYGTTAAVHGPLRPLNRPGNMLVFARCTNLTIENVTITGATYWTTHVADSDGVTVRNVKIFNNVTHPNNDGLHFTTCRNVLVEKCHIVCGDDAIAITGFNHPAGEAEIALGLSGIVGVCEGIEVRDCHLSSRSSAVRIGYGKNPVRRVTLRNLDIVDSNRGIGIYARQAAVENVTVENCRIRTGLFHGNWWGRGEPVQVSTVRFPGESRLFPIRDLVFRDIEASGENAFTLYSQEPGGIENVRLIRVQATLCKGELFEAWGGNLDLRPAADLKLAIHAGGTAPLWALGVARLEQTECAWRIAPGAESVCDAISAVR